MDGFQERFIGDEAQEALIRLVCDSMANGNDVPPEPLRVKAPLYVANEGFDDEDMPAAAPVAVEQDQMDDGEEEEELVSGHQAGEGEAEQYGIDEERE